MRGTLFLQSYCITAHARHVIECNRVNPAVEHGALKLQICWNIYAHNRKTLAAKATAATEATAATALPPFLGLLLFCDARAAFAAAEAPKN